MSRGFESLFLRHFYSSCKLFHCKSLWNQPSLIHLSQGVYGVSRCVLSRSVRIVDPPSGGRWTGESILNSEFLRPFPRKEEWISCETSNFWWPWIGCYSKSGLFRTVFAVLSKGVAFEGKNINPPFFKISLYPSLLSLSAFPLPVFQKNGGLSNPRFADFLKMTLNVKRARRLEYDGNDINVR